MGAGARLGGGGSKGDLHREGEEGRERKWIS